MAKILVVDDSSDLIELLSMLLKRKGYNVKTTLSIDGLQETISSFEPDLILLDVLLKEGNGRDLCKQIKEWNKSLPIVLISANPNLLEDHEECEADAVIEKPFVMQTVIKIVNKLLNLNKILLN